MGFHIPKQRLYASLLILGACILFYRTIMMISEGYLGILVLWVSTLLIAEFLIDISVIVTSIPWWTSKDRNKASTPLKLGATAAILHAVRVLIFVLGRIGPWVNFDVRPEHRALHYTRWSWFGVYFASILTVVGVFGVLIIWVLIRRARKKKGASSSKSY